MRSWPIKHYQWKPAVQWSAVSHTRRSDDRWGEAKCRDDQQNAMKHRRAKMWSSGIKSLKEWKRGGIASVSQMIDPQQQSSCSWAALGQWYVFKKAKLLFQRQIKRLTAGLEGKSRSSISWLEAISRLLTLKSVKQSKCIAVVENRQWDQRRHRNVRFPSQTSTSCCLLCLSSLTMRRCHVFICYLFIRDLSLFYFPKLISIVLHLYICFTRMKSSV